MNVSIRSLAVVLVLVSSSLVASCGGGSAKPVPGMGCAINSECATGLICTFGICHSACMVNGDCPTGELCVKTSTSNGDGGTINSCQLPFETKCVYTSDCKSPLVCARDEQCRNQCQTSVDCVDPQVCTTSGVCALASQLVTGTNDVRLVTPDGGAAGATGTGGTGAGTGGAGGQPATGGAGGGAGGATGTGGTGAGTGGAGGATGKGGAGGASATCSPACGVGLQCVNGACTACGMSATVCCSGSTPCGPNLTCDSSSNMCTCGAANEPCCGGTTCTTGLSCVNNVCSCGAAGENCCPNKTCTGSLVCGGLKCGCTTSCDTASAMKNDGSIWISNQPVQNIDASLFKAQSYSWNGNTGCAVKSDGTVYCWGSNYQGALGIGDTTVTSSTYPVQVVTDTSGTPLTGIGTVQVADTGYNVCAIASADGAVWCWGYGQYGELGIGAKANSSFAAKVVDTSSVQLTGATQLAVSNYNACALKSDHTLWCWGDNSEGQIGIGSSATTILNPTQVTALFSTVTSVVTSDSPYYVTCAGTMDGSAYCWGGNAYSELGNGLMSGMALVPSQVLTAASTPLANVASVVDWFEAYKMCALKTDATMWCWGNQTPYATALIDSSTQQMVTGITVTGRSCYLDNADLLWVNGAKYGYQITCN